MMQWSYLMEKRQDWPDWDRLGKQGWELVAVTSEYYYFKRPCEPKAATENGSRSSKNNDAELIAAFKRLGQWKKNRDRYRAVSVLKDGCNDWLVILCELEHYRNTPQQEHVGTDRSLATALHEALDNAGADEA